MNDASAGLSGSRHLVARLWQRCRNAARVLVSGGRTAGAAPQNFAGRWPDAASLLAHRMNVLQPDAKPPAAEDERRN